MPLWILTCKSLYKHTLFLSGKYLGMGWMGHMVAVRLTLKKRTNRFPKEECHFIFPSAVDENSIFSRFGQHLAWSDF